MEETTETPTQPALIPLVNREARIHQLMYRESQAEAYDPAKPVAPAETSAITLPPGLSYVQSDLLERAKFDPAAYAGRIVAEDPTRLADYQALELIESTKNRLALRIWLSTEARETIQTAIRRRLHEVPADPKVE